MLDGDRQELRLIKNELDDLKRLSSQQQQQKQQQAQAPTPSREAKSGGRNDDERQRLLKEKSDLLATGVYSSNHPIIMQLDKRLQSLWPSGSA